MTSDQPFPSNLTQIDKLTRGQHHYLTDADVCFFIGEYTARKGYSYSQTNSLVSNLKKGVQKKGTPEWDYKNKAIRTVAGVLRSSINDEFLKSATFVPIPPSKSKTDPLYDNRITRIVLGINKDAPVDCRELVIQKTSTAATHETDARFAPGELVENYVLDETLLGTPISTLVICDDVLTTGSHFKAVQSVLRTRFPDTPIVGCFVARRELGSSEFETYFK